MNKDPKVFDLEEAMRRVGRDRGLYKELVEIFHRELPVNLESLRSAVLANNLKQVEESAHSLKSALGNLSAVRAYVVAQRIEAAARAGSPKDLGHEVELLQTEIAQYSGEVKGQGF